MDGARRHAAPGQMHLASPIDAISRPTLTLERHLAVLLVRVDSTACPR